MHIAYVVKGSLGLLMASRARPPKGSGQGRSGRRTRTSVSGWAQGSVDDYILSAPVEARQKLREVRAAIRAAAPKAVEGISYRMPYYNYKGSLAWFGLHRSHVGLYLRPPVIEQHRTDLVGYVTTKGAVHIQLGERTPVGLIQKLIRARARMNEGDN